jgi:hypothetical protein
MPRNPIARGDFFSRAELQNKGMLVNLKNISGTSV